MARTTRIDREAVLDRAMALFWARGYSTVSVDDLVAATGAARYGLYGAFGDKPGLYKAALGRYEDVIVDRLFGGVDAPGASLLQIRGYFEALLTMAASSQGEWGCLFVNAMIERAPDDKEVRALCDAHRARLRKGFAAALKEGQSAAGPDALVALSLGISTAARSTASASALRDAVDQALAAK